jgi:hypothetical protein
MFFGPVAGESNHAPFGLARLCSPDTILQLANKSL